MGSRSDEGEPDWADDREMLTLSFSESDDELLNPERGYYGNVDLLDPYKSQYNVAELRERGYSLAIAQVRLDAFRFSDIDPAFLAELDRGFDAVRAHGAKVILRFKYNSSFSDDAPKESMLRHIEQLTPLLQEHSDVIAVMQAGFIGAWGEWHGSTFGLDNDDDRRDILSALLEALPESRAVAVRRPTFKAETVGDAVPETEAFTGSNRSRVGHHNDCFLASESDYGTYADPVTDWQSFVARDTRFTPMGGETCAVYEPRTNCDTAVEVMASHHWSYLNIHYNVDVLDSWDEGGCGDEVRQRLGYRYALEQVTHTESVPPGGELALKVDIANHGFASLYNERPVFAVISGDGVRRIARLDVDPRYWLGGETSSIATRLRIPADLEPGTYSLSLWMPDAAASLVDDPRYAVQLANDGVWSAETGENILTEELVLDPAAEGEVDDGATLFMELR